MAKAIQAWAQTEHLVPANPGGTPVAASDWPSVREQMMATAKAAITGNPQAVARMQAIAEIMGGRPPVGIAALPNFADLAAARHGDKAAITRLQQLRQVRQQGQPKRGQTGLQMQSFASFHPPLAKRAKRLQKMGSHMIAPVRAGGIGLKIFMTLLYLIIVPLLTVAAGLMLIVIGILIGMNLMLLALWLTAIHWIFVWLNGR
jgi:hypothetical protein